MAEWLQYLLEDGRVLCPEVSYQVRVHSTDTDQTRTEVTPVFAWKLDLILFSLFTTLALVGAGTVRAALE
jgi:hypothetical protein